MTLRARCACESLCDRFKKKSMCFACRQSTPSSICLKFNQSYNQLADIDATRYRIEFVCIYAQNTYCSENEIDDVILNANKISRLDCILKFLSF